VRLFLLRRSAARLFVDNVYTWINRHPPGVFRPLRLRSIPAHRAVFTEAEKKAGHG
jgi:hypothetical protein